MINNNILFIGFLYSKIENLGEILALCLEYIQKKVKKLLLIKMKF